MSLIKNSILNIVGFAIPTIIAIPALGLLARQLGVENFGLFTLAFAIVGYASIFDGGITRAVIREISIFRLNVDEQKKIVSTSTIIVLLLGFIASVLLYLGAKDLTLILKVSNNNIENATIVFKLLALVIPVYLTNQIWLAYLEGLEKFANINLQRVISGILISILPVAFCLIKPNLINATLGIIVGRGIAFFITFFLCRNIVFDSGLKFYKKTFKRLIEFGGWLTVSNIISPIMVYFDRFVISNIMGANKIAFYTAPAEAVSRLGNIPFALARALFPKLSFSNDIEEKIKLEKQSYFLISIVCLPVVIVFLFLSKQILTIWLGAEYADVSSNILQILILGFYFNALAQIPFSTLQARGKSKTTALIHIVEIIPYLILLFYLTYKFGLLGTAAAWSARMFVDLILMFIMARK